MDLKTFLQEAAHILRDVSETPLLDAQVLAAHCLKTNRSWVLAHPEAEIPLSELKELNSKVKQLREGFPLPYILGEWEFYGHKLEISPQVLIPRPETELLVDLALKWLTHSTQPKIVLDLGTGSGCIAVSIALGAPFVQIVASDLSISALQVARKNIYRYELENRIWLTCAKDFPPVCVRFDLICANLPYLSSHVLPFLPVAQTEPTLALDGGADGLQIYRRTIPAMRSRLTADSLLLCEIDPQQVQPMMEIAEDTFPGCRLKSYNDLSGNLRVIAIQPYPQNTSHHLEELLCS